MSLKSNPGRPVSIWILSIIALIFGALSIKSGGLALLK